MHRKIEQNTGTNLSVHSEVCIRFMQGIIMNAGMRKLEMKKTEKVRFLNFSVSNSLIPIELHVVLL